MHPSRRGTWGMLDALAGGLENATFEDLALHGLRHLGSFARAQRGSLYLTEASGGLRLAGRLGDHELPARVSEVRNGASLMLRSLSRHEALFLDDVEEFRRREDLARPGFQRPDPSCIVLPLLSVKDPTGVINLSALGRSPPNPGSMRRNALLHGARLLAMAIRMTHMVEELESRASTDGLTRLHNYSSFYEMLGREVFRAQRYGSDLTLILLDIDHFKALNDRFGHLGGDEVLREIARRMRAALRAPDLPARYAGDEFAVILPQTPLDGATRVARRIHTSIQQQPFIYLQTPIDVTVSMGVAELDDGMTAVDLVNRADRQLYSAKGAGRDRVSATP